MLKPQKRQKKSKSDDVKRPKFGEDGHDLIWDIPTKQKEGAPLTNTVKLGRNIFVFSILYLLI